MNDIIKGFKWHLPIAFKDCVAQCRFEHGDIIYKNKPVKDSWAELLLTQDYLIQVKSPSRSNITTTTSTDNSVFKNNWYSKVSFEKIYPNIPSQNELIETTQGQLFTFLIKGDEAIFQDFGTLLPLLTNISPKFINTEFIKSKIPKNYCGLAMIVNPASALHTTKKINLKDAFNKKITLTNEVFGLQEALHLEEIDLTKHSGIFPGLHIELLLIDSTNTIKVESIIKSALYQGKKDQFKISSHGYFFQN